MRCIHCGSQTETLVTLYSETNYALRECAACGCSVDELIEVAYSSKMLDLLLIRKPVFRHLLHNTPNTEALPTSLRKRLATSLIDAPSTTRLAQALILLRGCQAYPLPFVAFNNDLTLHHSE